MPTINEAFLKAHSGRAITPDSYKTAVTKGAFQNQSNCARNQVERIP